VLIFVQEGTNIPKFYELMTQYITLPTDYKNDKELMQRIDNYFDKARGIVKLNRETIQTPNIAKYKPTSFPKETELVGKQYELENLKKELENGESICLAGIGGIGKTAIAYKLIHLVKDKFTNIIPVYLNPTSNLIEFVLPFQRLYGNENNTVEELVKDFDKIIERLSCYPRNLIFIDNSELLLEGPFSNALSKIMSFLEVLPSNTQVLLTSRIEVDSNKIENMRITGLTTDEGVTLFKKVAANWLPMNITIELQNKITEVVQLIGGHPLAIKILARNFSKRNFRLEEIRDSDVLKITNNNETDERFKTVLKCFDYSFKMIDRRIRKSLAKLIIFEFPFTEEAVREILKISHSDFIKIYESGFLERLDISVRGLPIDTFFYDFHSLIREFILKKRTQIHNYDDQLVDYYSNLIKKAYSYNPFARAVFNSIMADYYLRSLRIFRKVIDYYDNLEERSNIINLIGLLLLKLGFYDEARPLFLEGLEIDKQIQNQVGIANVNDTKRIGLSELRIVNDTRNIGLSYMRSDKELALEYCKKALEEGKKIRHIDPIQYTEIGDILLSKNKFEEAFKYYDEGYRSASTKKGWTFIYCINAMSFYYHYQQKYLKSFGFSKMALKFLEFIKSSLKNEEYDYYLSIILPNLSVAYRRIGKIELAINNHLNVLQLDEKYHNVHGLLRDYHNLSTCYYELGKIDEGNLFYNKYVKLKGDLDHGIAMASSNGLMVSF
jgi:tetratricopeptide (TPR) repeat protein